MDTKAIEFTLIARAQLEDVIDYVVNEFGKRSAEKLLLLLEKHLENIAAGKVKHRSFYKSKHIQYFIANRKNYILYRETKKSIQVVGVYGVKQDIQKIKYKISGKPGKL